MAEVKIVVTSGRRGIGINRKGIGGNGLYLDLGSFYVHKPMEKHIKLYSIVQYIIPQ